MLVGIPTSTLWWPTAFFWIIFVMPNADLIPLRELFRAHVFKMLKKEGLIDDVFIKMLMSWNHVSGFSVHNTPGKTIYSHSKYPLVKPVDTWKEYAQKV